MELDPVWLLLLPALFALGWITARYDRGQQTREGQHVSDDVMHAMSDLLADDAQAATDRLLSAARADPDAIELQRAVGNLYRKRGLIDRAIEVHEAALRHPQLQTADRLALMADLGRDYQAAGLFDRAEAVLNELLANAGSDALANQARTLLMQIAQVTRNWNQAIEMVKALQQYGGEFHGHSAEQLLGHFYCELAEAAIARGDQSAALANLAQAEKTAAPGPTRRIAALRARLTEGAAEVARQPGMQVPAESTATSSKTAPVVSESQSACRVCGFRSRQTLWQCPGCHHSDSFEALR